jgi:hypothetical protein
MADKQTPAEKQGISTRTRPATRTSTTRSSRTSTRRRSSALRGAARSERGPAAPLPRPERQQGPLTQRTPGDRRGPGRLTRSLAAGLKS